MNAKSVSIFMEEGTFDGVVSAEIGNFVGKVTTAPRFDLAKLFNRQELKTTGIYILVGDNVFSKRPTLYIGRSDNILNRLKNYNDGSIISWSKAALIYSKDQNLTYSHICYLESKLINLAKNSDSIDSINKQMSELPDLPKSQISDMESYFKNVRLLLEQVRFNYFDATKKTVNNYVALKSDRVIEDSPIFHLNKFNVNVYAQKINNKFVIFKNSTARNYSVDSFADRYKELREKLISEGKLSYDRHSSKLIFTQDVVFSTCTSATSVLLGRNSSGKKYFKIKGTNVSLKEWEERKKLQAFQGDLKVIN